MRVDRLVVSMLVLLLAVPASVAAQQVQADDYDPDAWLVVPFTERERLFEAEARSSEWADGMEQAIAEKVAELDRPLEEVVGRQVCSLVPMCKEVMPPVELLSVECRSTLCRIEMRWPPETFRGIVGQQISFLYELGIDHQGESDVYDDASGKRVVLIARRRV